MALFSICLRLGSSGSAAAVSWTSHHSLACSANCLEGSPHPWGMSLLCAGGGLGGSPSVTVRLLGWWRAYPVRFRVQQLALSPPEFSSCQSCHVDDTRGIYWFMAAHHLHQEATHPVKLVKNCKLGQYSVPWHIFSGVPRIQLTKRNMINSRGWYPNVKALELCFVKVTCQVQPHKNKSHHLACPMSSMYLYTSWLTPPGRNNSMIVSGHVDTQEVTGTRLRVTLTALIWVLELAHTLGQLRAQWEESKICLYLSIEEGCETNAVHFWTLKCKEAASKV